MWSLLPPVYDYLLYNYYTELISWEKGRVLISGAAKPDIIHPNSIANTEAYDYLLSLK